MRIVFGLVLATCLASQAFAAPRPVTTRTLAEAAFHPERSAPAAVVSLNDSRLSAELTARITEIPVQVGEAVKAGQVLVRLDARDYELAVEQAQASLKGLDARVRLAESQLGRAGALLEQKNISEELYNQRQAELDVLLAEREAQQVALATARRNLERATLRAPFPAVVLERLGHVGEYARPGDPLLRVVDTQRIELSAAVQANDVTSLQAAKGLQFKGQGRSYTVRLRALVPVYEARERTREARLRFEGQAAFPGAAGRLVWTEPQLHLPPDLVVRRGGQLGVFVLAGAKAVFAPLDGAEEGRPVAVNLPQSTRVIVDGRHVLQDGDAVSPR